MNSRNSNRPTRHPWIWLCLSLLALMGAAQPAVAVPFGPGDTLSLGYDLSSAPPSTNNPHTFQIEFVQLPPSNTGGYSISWEIISSSSAVLGSSPVWAIGGGNPGPMMLAVTLSSAADLIGTITATIVSGPGGLGNVTGAELTVFDGSSNFIASQSIPESAFTVTAVPEPSTLVLAALGLLCVGALVRRERGSVRTAPIRISV